MLAVGAVTVPVPIEAAPQSSVQPVGNSQKARDVCIRSCNAAVYSVTLQQRHPQRKAPPPRVPATTTDTTTPGSTLVTLPQNWRRRRRRPSKYSHPYTGNAAAPVRRQSVRRRHAWGHHAAPTVRHPAPGAIVAGHAGIRCRRPRPVAAAQAAELGAAERLQHPFLLRAAREHSAAIAGSSCVRPRQHAEQCLERGEIRLFLAAASAASTRWLRGMNAGFAARITAAAAPGRRFSLRQPRAPARRPGIERCAVGEQRPRAPRHPPPRRPAPRNASGEIDAVGAPGSSRKPRASASSPSRSVARPILRRRPAR